MVAAAASAGPSRGACLGSWRIDATAGAWPLLTIAATVTTLGGCFIGAAFVNHGPLAHMDWVPLLGGMCMLAGPLIAIIGLRGLLVREEYVVALERGLLVRIDGGERFLAWGELAAVRWRGEQATLSIEPRDGEAIAIARPFALVKGDELATKLDDWRRKAEFDLIRR